MCEQMMETTEAACERRRDADAGMLPGAETILFVEDEAFVREVTREVLRSAGYYVLTASNAADAVGVYDAGRSDVDLLLTDVVLPGETGRALAGRLRRENPGLQVLLVTGYAEQMALGNAKREEYLAKPFSSEELLRRVRELLDRRGLLTVAENSFKHAGGNGWRAGCVRESGKVEPRG